MDMGLNEQRCGGKSTTTDMAEIEKQKTKKTNKKRSKRKRRFTPKPKKSKKLKDKLAQRVVNASTKEESLMLKKSLTDKESDTSKETEVKQKRKLSAKILKSSPNGIMMAVKEEEDSVKSIKELRGKVIPLDPLFLQLYYTLNFSLQNLQNLASPIPIGRIIIAPAGSPQPINATQTVIESMRQGVFSPTAHTQAKNVTMNVVN